MHGLNEVTLMGNATRDIEIRFTPKGTPVCDVGLAMNERVKHGDDWQDEVTYMDVTFFGKSAETIGKYLHKGDPFWCRGRLRQDTWEKDGKTQRKTKVMGDKFLLLPNGHKGSKHDPAPPPVTDRPPGTGNDNHNPMEEDEIPF